MRDDNATYRYWAYISSSREDRLWARWLHRAIERYGIPARLVNHPTPAGDPAPRCFRPVFRDTALPDAQRDDALLASRYLIVICSPHAASSYQINREIETFQRLGRGRRVLAVIVSGEPNAGDDRECFPESLRHAEPIAADARPSSDGKENARLKLLAGMLGVGFDELKQRDTRRRMRRLQLAIGLISVLSLGFAGLSVYAGQQRDEAVEAREQAEDVLEILVFDLRAELAPVGRLDIARGVEEKVGAYYQELGEGRSTPTALQNRAAAARNRAERLQAQGDLEGALRECQTSLQVLERLTSSDPSNLEWQANVCSMRAKVGDVLRAQGDLGSAVLESREALRQSVHLSSCDPDNPEWKTLVGEMHGHLGDLILEQGDLTGALREYHAALDISQDLLSSEGSGSERAGDVPVYHHRIGSVLEAKGDLDGALRWHRESLRIAQEFSHAAPRDTRWKRAVAVGHDRIGLVLQAQGDLEGALREYEASQLIDEELASWDPSNAEWQRGLSLGHTYLGHVYKAQGDVARAARAYEAAAAIAEQLSSSERSNSQWQSDLAVARTNVGDVLLEAGDTEGALREYQEVLRITERLHSWNRNTPERIRGVAVAHERIGGVLQEQGDLVGALREYRESLGLSQELRTYDPSNSVWKRDVSVGRAQVGEVLQAQGDLAGALKEFQAGLEISEEQVLSEPSNVEWQRDLAIRHGRVGEVLQAQGDFTGASREYHAGVAVLEALSNRSQDVRLQRELLAMYARMADVELLMDGGHSMFWMRKAQELLSSMKRRGIAQPSDEQWLGQLNEAIASTPSSAYDPKGTMGAKWGMSRDEVRRLRDSWPEDIVRGYHEDAHAISFTLSTLSFETVAFRNAMVILGFEEGVLESGCYIIPVHRSELPECDQWYDEIKSAMTDYYGAPGGEWEAVDGETLAGLKGSLGTDAMEIERVSSWALGTTRADLLLSTAPVGKSIWVRYSRR